MQIEITGKIVAVLPTQSGNSSKGTWVKNAFVIKWSDNGYTQNLCLEVMGEDKFEKMRSAVVVGNEVLCKFNVSSREWQGRWFTACNCFYCGNVGATAQQGGGGALEQSPVATSGGGGSDDDEVPF